MLILFLGKKVWFAVSSRLKDKLENFKRQVLLWSAQAVEGQTYDNRVVTESCNTTMLLENMGVAMLSQHPYLTPSDFFLFPNAEGTPPLQARGRGKNIIDLSSTGVRWGLQAAYEKWVKYWKMCIESGEEYVKKVKKDVFGR